MTGCILVVTLKNEGNNYVSLSLWWYRPKSPRHSLNNSRRQHKRGFDIEIGDIGTSGISGKFYAEPVSFFILFYLFFLFL